MLVMLNQWGLLYNDYFSSEVVLTRYKVIF